MADDGKGDNPKLKHTIKSAIKVRAKGYLNPKVEGGKPSKENSKDDKPDSPVTMTAAEKPKGQPHKRAKIEQYERQTVSGQDSTFVKSASLGGVATYSVSRLYPAQYLQLGVMAFLVNMSTYMQCMYFTGGQRPKTRSHPGLSLLWDNFTFPYLMLKTYITHSLNVMDPERLTFESLMFSSKEELLSRINSYQCSAAASVLRMYTGCGRPIPQG